MRKNSQKGIKQTEQYWRSQIARFKNSGLSQTVFCEKVGLNPNTFSKWKCRLALVDSVKEREFLEVAVSEPPTFVSLTEVQGSSKTAAMSAAPLAEIDLASRVVRVFAGIDRHALYEVLAALREMAL